MIAQWFQKTRLAALAASTVLLLAPSASRAGVLVTVEAPGIQQSQQASVTTETFDSQTLGSHTLINSPIGTYTAPFPGLVVVSPDAFGGAYQTQYIAIGAQSGQVLATLTFNTPQAYFGLYFSAIDAKNSLQVYDGVNLLTTIDETSLAPMLQTTGGPNGLGHYGNPNTGADLSEAFVYVNIFGTSGTTFTTIRFANDGTGTGFESDNHSILASSPVPEPSTFLAASIGALGLIGQGLRRRSLARRKAIVA